MSDLKPCPFCGHSDLVRFKGGRVCCLKCNVFGPLAETEEESKVAWNAASRPEPRGRDDEYIDCPHCSGGAFREGIAYTCTRCETVTAIEPKVEPPLDTPEKLYRDLLNHLGCNGHDGALTEIEALRRHAGLSDETPHTPHTESRAQRARLTVRIMEALNELNREHRNAEKRIVNANVILAELIAELDKDGEP